MNLSQLAVLTEDQAREYFEGIRWADGVTCPHGRSKEVTKLQGKATRPGVYKCRVKGCRKQFTVTVGTIMERSHVSMKHWLMAFHLLCSSKKGFSALQLQRELGVTYKTAFIGTPVKHDLSSTPVLGKDGKPIRATGQYRDEIGKTFKTVEGAKPTYTLTGEELYVRATVTSTKPAVDPSFKDQLQQAWTQPVGWEAHVAK